MGPTKVYHAQFTAPASIRGSFGLSDTRNAVHGSGEFDGQSVIYDSSTALDCYLMGTNFWFSDSSESAAREIGIFFPGFSIDRWFLEEEEYFKKGAVKLCAQEFIHNISSIS